MSIRIHAGVACINITCNARSGPDLAKAEPGTGAQSSLHGINFELFIAHINVYAHFPTPVACRRVCPIYPKLFFDAAPGFEHEA